MDMVVTVQSSNNWPALVYTFTRKSYSWHCVTQEERQEVNGDFQNTNQFLTVFVNEYIQFLCYIICSCCALFLLSHPFSLCSPQRPLSPSQSLVFSIQLLSQFHTWAHFNIPDLNELIIKYYTHNLIPHCHDPYTIFLKEEHFCWQSTITF